MELSCEVGCNQNERTAASMMLTITWNYLIQEMLMWDNSLTSGELICMFSVPKPIQNESRTNHFADFKFNSF